jgi:hypothetical protein
VAPSRDKPLIFFAAFLLVVSSLLFGYIHWYHKEADELRGFIRDVDFKKADPESKE